MKKIIGLLMILVLLVIGCSNKENTEKTISSKLDSYDITVWEKSDNKQEEIIKEIMKVWEDNNELYDVNFQVNNDSVKARINEYINNNSPKQKTSIFKIACEVVGIESSSYTVK